MLRPFRARVLRRFLTLQKKLRNIGALGEEFWNQQSLELVVMMEEKGLWSAKELHRHAILKKKIRRPPPKYGGEADVEPPEGRVKKSKGIKNVDKAPPMPISKKHRRTALKGEELIDACLASRFVTDDQIKTSGPGADDLMKDHARNLMRDEAARKATLIAHVRAGRGGVL